MSAANATDTTGTLPRPAPPAAAPGPTPLWRRLLEMSFLLSNGARVFAYLPTLWAMAASSDATQHSLWTWGTWMAANGTMALWLLDRNRSSGGRRLDRAVLVSAVNGAMCLAAVLLILWLRR